MSKYGSLLLLRSCNLFLQDKLDYLCLYYGFFFLIIRVLDIIDTVIRYSFFYNKLINYNINIYLLIQFYYSFNTFNTNCHIRVLMGDQIKILKNIFCPDHPWLNQIYIPYFHWNLKVFIYNSKLYGSQFCRNLLREEPWNVNVVFMSP